MTELAGKRILLGVSGSIAAYRVDHNGGLTLLSGVAGFTGAGSHPSDMALSHNSQFLYALANTTHSIGAFAVQCAQATPTVLQAICDWFECRSMEAVEALREALRALKAELLDEED